MGAAKFVAAWVMVILVGGLAGIILWKIWAGKIDLAKLISEANGDASMSRFQFLMFTFVVSILAGLMFGVIPVFKYAGAHVASGLRGGGRTSSASRERHRARSTLVVVQVALALVLLISSGLMIRTFQAMRQVNPGFSNPGQLLTMSLSIPSAQVKEPEAVVRMHQAIMERIGASRE